MILADDDWEQVKEAIAAVREGTGGQDSIEILESHSLWDEEGNCPDEEEINVLYIRGA